MIFFYRWQMIMKNCHNVTQLGAKSSETAMQATEKDFSSHPAQMFPVYLPRAPKWFPISLTTEQRFSSEIAKSIPCPASTAQRIRIPPVPEMLAGSRAPLGLRGSFWLPATC